MLALQNLPPINIVASVILAILILTTVVYGVLRWKHRGEQLLKFGSRLQTWWITAGVFILALLFYQRVLLFFVAFVCYMALKEFLSLTPTRRADRRVLFLAYLTIPLQFFLIWQRQYILFSVGVPAYIFIVLPLGMVMAGETKGFLQAYGTLVWGTMATVYSLGHLGYLLMLAPSTNPITGGAGLFLFIVLLTQLNDVAQYTVSKLIHSRKIVPAVSTTRSWSGLLGGIIFTALISWLVAPLLTPFTPIESLVAGGIIAVSGLSGYLILSAIKGDLGLTDRSTMVLGQGGVLNRVDTLIFTTPIFFHLVFYLYFWDF